MSASDRGVLDELPLLRFLPDDARARVDTALRPDLVSIRLR